MKQLTSSMAEVRSAIQMLQNSQDRMGNRITETEQHISKIEDDREAENQQVQQLEQRIAAVAERIRVEEGNLIAFLQKALPGLLGLESGADLEMERAHQALGPHPAQGQRPGAFIVKLSRYPTRERLLWAARLKGQVMWQEQRISLYPDLSRDLQMKRQRFWDVRKILQERKIKYGVFYPAILKITINRETTAFTTPEDARRFLS
uniref:L1 transposable element RRM domain-containing protein n=1 Tax=Latimeria chalumnae TaxID=7897 RepID=H3AMY2_LATCH